MVTGESNQCVFDSGGWSSRALNKSEFERVVTIQLCHMIPLKRIQKILQALCSETTMSQ